MDRPGQLNRETVIGKKIYELTTLPEISTVVDIGTWNGNGSTRCIYEGILESRKKDYKVLSFEIDRNFYKQAKFNLFPPLNNFDLVYGSLVSYEELIKQREIYGNHKWLEEDLVNLSKAPYVFNMVPEKINLCVMDGGEFSGYIEFTKLWKRCDYIVLDDTLTYKHTESRKFILDNLDDFTVIYDNINERNGCMIVNVKQK